MADQVECHSGYAYGERPVAFQWEGQRLEVKELISGAHAEQGRRFRVLAGDGETYELAYNQAADDWQITPL
jgi:hypothetical protein